MAGLHGVIQLVRGLVERLCSVWWVVFGFFFLSFSLVAFLLFYVGQGFIAQIDPACVA